MTDYGPHYGFQNRYLLRLPGDPKAKLRTRATTFIKSIDDASGLIPWSMVMAMVGLSKSTALRAEWAALLAAHPDPYYDGDTAKQAAKDIADRAKEAGGGGERRDIGTALHGILESVVTGQVLTLDLVDDEFRWHVTAVMKALDDAGYDVVPELCERSVYHSSYDVCGRFDLILRRRSDNALVIGDLKTGGEMWAPRLNYKTKQQTGWYDAHEMNDLTESAQLALYASADLLITWPANPHDECTTTPMVELDQSEGVIVHAPSTIRDVALRRIDLAVGRRALELSAAVRDIRRTKALIERIGVPPPAVEPIDVPVDITPPINLLGGFDRDWLVGRLKGVLAHSDLARAEMVRTWPAGVPTFKASAAHTQEQYAAIDRAIFAVEERFNMEPFGAAPKAANIPLLSPDPQCTMVQMQPTAEVADGEPLENKPGQISTLSETAPATGVAPTPAPSQPIGDLPAVLPDGVYVHTRDGLLERMRAIVGHTPEAGAEMAQRWPDGVPTFKQSADHTPAQLARIEQIMCSVEGGHGVPFIDPPVACHQCHTVPVSTAGAVCNACAAPRLSASPPDSNESPHPAIPADPDGPAAVARQALSEVSGGDVEIITLLARASGMTDVHASITAQMCDRIVAVCDAINADLLQLTDHGPDGFTISIAPGVEELIITRYEGRRAALDACKLLARTYGLAIPKSLATAATDPALVALAIYGPHATKETIS